MIIPGYNDYNIDKCCFSIQFCWRKGKAVFLLKDYIFSNDFSKNLDAMIYTCGYEKCSPAHSYGPAVRSGYLIHYILGGKGIYKTEGHLYHLSDV